MNLSLIITSVITIAAIGLIFHKDGQESGLIQVAYIFVCLAIYLSTIYYYGQTGKNYLAIFLAIAVCGVFYIRKKKGLKIWW